MSSGSVDRRSVGIGVLVWLVVSCVSVVARGVRLDETFEHAQVIAGLVQYPAGHPLTLYLREVFSLQSSGAALAVGLLPDPVFLSSLRNVLGLLATVLPAFLLTTLLVRSSVWGHVAALFTLMGFHWCFGSYYPLVTWPGLYSIGHIGMSYALIVFFLLLSGRWRVGFFLLGLMPAVHLGQLPVVLGVALLMVGQAARARRRDRVLSALLWSSAGFGVFLILVFGLAPTSPPAAEGGAYDVAGDVRSIWQGFTTHFDDHRGYPGSGTLFNSFIAIAVAFLFGGAAARLESQRGERGGAWFWIWVYTTLASLIFVGVQLVHLATGAEIPFWLIAWMPYRMVNHVIVLTVVMLAGILGGRTREPSVGAAAAGVAVVALLFGAARPYLATVVGAEAYARFFEIGAPGAFAFVGAALAVLASRLREIPRLHGPWLGGVLASTLPLVWLRPAWALSLVLGGIAVVAVSAVRKAPAGPVRATHPALAVACVLATILLVAEEARNRAHLARTDFEMSVARHLEREGRPGTLLLGEPQSVFLQAKAGFPVAADAVTASLISYRPELGPTIQSMYHDFYGLRFDEAAAARGWGQLAGWQALWAHRSRSEWSALGRRYSVAFVIAPAEPMLDLPLVLRGADRALYRVPATDEPAAD